MRILTASPLFLVLFVACSSNDGAKGAQGAALGASTPVASSDAGGSSEPSPEASASDGGPTSEASVGGGGDAGSETSAPMSDCCARPPVPFPAKPDGGDILVVDSGSTNYPGYRIDIEADGSATWQLTPAHYTPSCASPDAAVVGGKVTLDPALVSRFYADLNAAAGSLLVFEGCAKSASFGTTTRLTYGGASIEDTQCPDDANTTAIAADVKAVVAAVAPVCP